MFLKKFSNQIFFATATIYISIKSLRNALNLSEKPKLGQVIKRNWFTQMIIFETNLKNRTNLCKNRELCQMPLRIFLTAIINVLFLERRLEIRLFLHAIFIFS